MSSCRPSNGGSPGRHSSESDSTSTAVLTSCRGGSSDERITITRVADDLPRTDRQSRAAPQLRDEMFLARDRDCLEPGMDAKRSQKAADMISHRFRAEVEL